MTSSNRARAIWVLANLIVIGGFLTVLPLLAASFMPGAATPLLALVPELPQAKQISWVPGGLATPILAAVAGLIVMFVGSAIASRQRHMLEFHRVRREDAQRRVEHYRSDGRIEPTLRPE